MRTNSVSVCKEKHRVLHGWAAVMGKHVTRCACVRLWLCGGRSAPDGLPTKGRVSVTVITRVNLHVKGLL